MRAPLTRTHILFFFTAGPAARFRRSARSRSGVHQPGRYTLRAHKSRLCRIVDVAHLTGRVSLLLLLRTQFGHTALQGRSRMRAACDTRRVRFRHRPSCGLLAHLFLEELLATALNHTVEVWRCLHALRVLAAWAKAGVVERKGYEKLLQLGQAQGRAKRRVMQHVRSAGGYNRYNRTIPTNPTISRTHLLLTRCAHIWRTKGAITLYAKANTKLGMFFTW
mmetsp:Transcript_42930/g.115599  ORF Transcript_42930/g.115599 Transcript_42930/m.115599 type:complete len:221 (-) Transcript_42930:1042-1704(-)